MFPEIGRQASPNGPKIRQDQLSMTDPNAANPMPRPPDCNAALVLAEIDQITESQVRRPRGVKPAASERGAQ